MRKNMYGPLGLSPPLELHLELVKAFCIIIARHREFYDQIPKKWIFYFRVGSLRLITKK